MSLPNVPKRIADRLAKQVGTFQRVLQDAKDRDVNEADVTSEQAIRGTYCDLAERDTGVVRTMSEIRGRKLATSR